MTGHTPSGDFVTSLADRYVVERKLGAGAMATVFLARDVRHDRPVAIKVLGGDVLMDVQRHLGERDAALTALEQGIAERSDWMYSTGTQPFLKDLHGEPGFPAVLTKLELASRVGRGENR